MNLFLFLKAILYKLNLNLPRNTSSVKNIEFNNRLDYLLTEGCKIEESNTKITAKIKSLSFNIVKNLSEEKDLKALVEIIENNASEAFITFHKDGTIHAVNRAAMTMFSYTLEEFAFINIFDILPLIHLYCSEKRELSALSKDLHKFPVEVKIERLKEEDQFMAVILNISDKKDLIELNTFIKSVFHNSENPMYHKDKNFYYVGCNKKFEELCGKTSNEIIGRTAYELFPEDVAEFSTTKELNLVNDKHNNTKTYNCSIHTFLNPDRKSILVINNLILDSNGNNNGLIGTIIDLTNQLLLRRKEDKEFATLFNDLLLPIVITDSTGVILFSNESFGKMVGYLNNDIDNFNICTFVSNITSNSATIISKNQKNKSFNLKVIRLPSINKNLSVYIFSEGGNNVS